MRIPQKRPGSRGVSPYAAGTGRAEMLATSPRRSPGIGLGRGGTRPSGGTPFAKPSKGGPPFRKSPGYGPPGWYPPGWRGGIVSAAPLPVFGPGAAAAASDAGGPDDAAWQAPMPLNRVAPTTGP